LEHSRQQRRGVEGAGKACPMGESNKFVYEGEAGTHKWYDGLHSIRGNSNACGISSHHSPIRTRPIAGVEDAAIFKTTDGGKNVERTVRLCAVQRGASGQPGAGGMAVHTILLDPKK